MRVKSKLADVDFQCGLIKREGHHLVITSHKSQAMKTVVYVSPGDALTFMVSILTSPSAILFILAFPYFWWRAYQESRSSAQNFDEPW